MSKPLSYSGIETAGKSSLFFKSRAGKLVQLVEQGRDQKYTKNTVKLGGSELKIGGDSFAAVSYTDTEKTEQVRVYYIDRNDDDASEWQVKEICQTDGGEWYPGSLNHNTFSTSPDSLLAANVEHEKGDLKVYYLNPKGITKACRVTVGTSSTGDSQEWIQEIVYTDSYD